VRHCGIDVHTRTTELCEESSRGKVIQSVWPRSNPGLAAIPRSHLEPRLPTQSSHPSTMGH
jgi:hypothetical protein